MANYIIIAWYRKNGSYCTREFSLVGSSYPRIEDVLSVLDISYDDLVDYEVHY